MQSGGFEAFLSSREFRALEAVYAAKLPRWLAAVRRECDRDAVLRQIRSWEPAEVLGGALRLLQVLEFYFRRPLRVRQLAHRTGRWMRPDPFLYAADMERWREIYVGWLTIEVPNWLGLVSEQQYLALRVSVRLDLLGESLRNRLEQVPRVEPVIRGLIFGEPEALRAAVRGVMNSKTLKRLWHPFDEGGGSEDKAACIRQGLAEMYVKAAPVAPLGDDSIAELQLATDALSVLISAGRLANGPSARLLSIDDDREFAFLRECLGGLLGKVCRRGHDRLVDEIRKLAPPTTARPSSDEDEEGAPQAVEQYVEDIGDANTLDALTDLDRRLDMLATLENLRATHPRLYAAVRESFDRGADTLAAVARAAGVSPQALDKWLEPVRAAWRQDERDARTAPGLQRVSKA